MDVEQHSTTTDIILGAVAGGVATVALGGVSTVIYEREDKLARWQEDHARDGLSAYEIAADKATDLTGIRLSKDRWSAVGTGLHYGLGVGSGAAYGAVRRSIPPCRRSAAWRSGPRCGWSPMKGRSRPWA
jgi:hypothetical protein